MRRQFNVRLPGLTQNQLSELVTMTGMTTTQVVILAIDALYRQLTVEANDAYRNQQKSSASSPSSTGAQDCGDSAG